MINFNIFNLKSLIIIILRYPSCKLLYLIIILFNVEHFMYKFNFRLHLLIIFKFTIVIFLILFIFHVNLYYYIKILIYYVFNQILLIVFTILWKNYLIIFHQTIVIEMFVFHVI